MCVCVCVWGGGGLKTTSSLGKNCLLSLHGRKQLFKFGLGKAALVCCRVTPQLSASDIYLLQDVIYRQDVFSLAVMSTGDEMDDSYRVAGVRGDGTSLGSLG